MLEHVAAHDLPIEATEQANPVEEIRTLEARLQRGWTVISDAEARGEPTDVYYHHFLDLLQRYEALCDAFRAA